GAARRGRCGLLPRAGTGDRIRPSAGFLHRREEDVLERVALEREVADRDVSLLGELVDVGDREAVRQDDFRLLAAAGGALAAGGAERGDERAVASRVDLQEPPVRAALLLEVAVLDDAAVLQDQHL